MFCAKAANGVLYLVIFPHGRRCTPLIRNWRMDGTWLRIHDYLRVWTRIEQGRHPSPSEAVVDCHCVKSAAIMSQDVEFDGGN